MNTKTDSSDSRWPGEGFLAAVAHPVFRHALETLLIVVDRRGHIVFSNRAFQAVSGFSEAELLGEHFCIVLPEPQRGPVMARFAEQVSGGEFASNFVIPLCSKTGELFYIHWATTVLVDDDGNFEYLVGSGSDVSEQQHTLQALQASEERLRLSQQFAEIGNWEWDIGSGSLYWSAQTWALFGQPLGTFRPSYQRFIECVHPDDRAKLARAIDETLRHGTAYDVEYRVIWHDGEIHWLRGTGNVVRDGEEQPVRMLGLVSNIDRHKDAEQAQQKQAEAQRNVLVREVHHRIKNNLQGIVGLLRNHLQGIAGDPRAIVEKAIAQVNAIALIHGIHGQRVGQELRLCEMLPAIVDNHTRSDQTATDIALTIDIDSPLQVQDDEAVPVALILNELITNAIKHANRRKAHDQVRVSLSVEDGRGRIAIHCPGGCLPAGFDFQAGVNLGTGLELVHALLPPAGMSIEYQRDTAGVVTTVMLQAPVVRGSATRRGGCLAET